MGTKHWQIYCRGVLLKTNYEKGSVFKLFTRRVCSSMDAARGTGDIGVPPLQMARSMLSWRVPPVAQARYTMLECRQCKWRYAVNYYNIYYKYLLITLLFHFQMTHSNTFYKYSYNIYKQFS